MLPRWGATLALCLVVGAFALLILAGCKTSAADAVPKAIAVTDREAARLDEVQDQKTAEAANYVFATGVALREAPEELRPVEVATQMNDRAQGLLGAPDAAQIVEIQNRVGALLSENVELRAQGIRSQVIADKKISELSQREKQAKADLEAAQLKERETATKAAKEVKEANDERDQIKDKYEGGLLGFLGIKSVWAGLHRLVTVGFWVIVIGGVLLLVGFILLRNAARFGGGPIATAVFGIIENIIAVPMRWLGQAAPGAIEKAGHVTHEVFSQTLAALDVTNSGFRKVVDAIQTARDAAEQHGKPVTIEGLLGEIKMSDAEKAVVKRFLKELNWIKD
jgi:hypothetical protein